MDANEQAERDAKRREALKHAKAAALMEPPDLAPLQELARIEESEIQEADAAADLAERVANAKTAREALAELAPAPAPATATDWTGDPEPRAWTAPAWLPSGRAALFTGPGGGGKSLFALQLAAGIASGDRNPFRCDPRSGADQAPMLDGDPGPALFCTWEDEPSEVLRRLAWAHVDRAALADRLHVADMAGRGPLWEATDGAGGCPTDAGAAVESLIRDLRPRLAVIDPTAGAFAANENDRAAVRGWLSHLGALAAETGAAALLIAHPPKDAQHAFSGSTDWRGGVRSLWTLRPEALPGWTGGKGDPKAPAQARALTLDKANYAKDGRRAWLRLHVQDGPAPGDPPALMRWEESTAREAAEAYHDWRGWDAPERKPDKSETRTKANGRTGTARRPEAPSFA